MGILQGESSGDKKEFSPLYWEESKRTGPQQNVTKRRECRHYRL